MIESDNEYKTPGEAWSSDDDVIQPPQPTQKINRIKQQDAPLRGYLAKLAVYAYSIPQAAREFLDLNTAQANKYHRYAFIFDPKKDYEEAYAELFETIFGNQARAVFDALKAAHPFGVQITVNDSESRHKPLLEHNFIVAGQSVLNGAKMMLDDSYKLQSSYISSEDNFNKKYQLILENITQEYEKYIDKINEFYNDDLNKDNFKKAQQLLNAFQSRVIYHLTCFEIPPSKHTKDDYSRNYKLLGIYEQKRRVPEEDYHPTDEAAKIFNRDLFVLNIHEGNSPEQVRFQYHERHLVIEGKVSPAETAHSPEFGLANYALVEEGTYNFEDESTEIDSISSRHGSAAPNELYTGKHKKPNRHESTYRAYLNMQQNLQNLRAKVIESILRENSKRLKLSEENIIHYSQVLAYDITNAIHEKKEVSLRLILRELDNDEFGGIFDLLTMNHEGEILNIKNFYTHVITPTGFGSNSEDQRYHYRDTRLAQYVTHLTDNNEILGGYIYFAAGVNGSRYDTKTFDFYRQKLRGNNSVAMIEYYRQLVKQYPADFLNKIKDNKLWNEYYIKLAAVQKAANEYFENIEIYLAIKLARDEKYNRLKDIENLLRIYKNGSYNFDNNKILILEAERKKVIDELFDSDLVSEEKNKKIELDNLRKAFKSKEIELHEVAKELNKNIYHELSWNEIEINILDDIEDSRESYLAWKAYQLAQKLFNEKNWLGTRKWKLDKYNGIMQALLQFGAPHADMFGSFGCKSANDRALLIALLISALSKIENSEQRLDDTYIENLLENAQRAYALHISRDQTGLDSSAIPKTGADILRYAGDLLKEVENSKKDEFGKHKKFGKIAAHKRTKMPKNFDEAAGKAHIYQRMKNDLDSIQKNSPRDFKWCCSRFRHFQEVINNVNHLVDNSIYDNGYREGYLTYAHKDLTHLIHTHEFRYNIDHSTECKIRRMQVEADYLLYKEEVNSHEIELDEEDLEALVEVNTKIEKIARSKNDAPFPEILRLCNEEAKKDEDNRDPARLYFQIRRVLADYRSSVTRLGHSLFDSKELKEVCYWVRNTNLIDQVTSEFNFTEINNLRNNLDRTIARMEQPHNSLSMWVSVHK